MNHLEIKHLRMIRAIAEAGTMTRAAQRLHISQSALSQQLKDIECKLKVDLFFRTRKKMILTPIGQRLSETAQNVIAAVEDQELEIAKIVSGDQGELKVGTQCIFCYRWLPGVMRLFQDRFPNIEFTIGNAGELADEMQSGRYDLIITASAARDERCAYLPLFSDQLVCIMPPDHPLSGRACVQFEDFGRFNFISHAEKAQNRFFQFILKPRGIKPKRVMTVGQPPAMIELVAAGFGLSVFPQWAVNGTLHQDGITARPITKSGFPMTWQAAYPVNAQLQIFQREFISIVSKADVPGMGAPARRQAVGI